MKRIVRSVICYLLAVLMIGGNIGFAHVYAAGSGDVTDGLLAYYDFENVSGTSVPNAADAASYTGTLSGSAAIVDIEGVAQPSKALKLGSAAGGMQLTNIVNASTTSFSVSMWYKASATSRSNVNLIQAGTIGGTTGRTVLILAPEAKYYTYLTGDNAKTMTANAISPMTWQHITFGYDQAANKAYFYVNGVADREAGLSLSGTPLNVSDMIIGRHRNDNEGQFNGLIDEVRIYNKVLSADEAAAIYESGKDAFGDPVIVASDTTLTVDAGNTLRIIDSDSIFGINHRYAFNGYGSFDSENMKIKDDFLALYEDAGFGSIRYPGGTISNLFNWKTTIGPVEQRKDQIHGFYNNAGQGGIAPNFGLTEIGTFAESVGSEIVYVYSLGRGNAQDAADLIEYLNARVGTNPNGGIDWAAVRAANGHPDPYNVRYFEIGNEMQQAWGGSDGTASQGYWTTSVDGGSENAYIDGGTAVFTKQYAVCEENWNAVASRSDGSANMVRYMRYANVNPRMEDGNGSIVDDPNFKAVNHDVSVFVGSTQWTVVDSFENSGANDQHVVIDYSTGAIKFGDGVHGAIPTSGEQIYVSYSVDRQGFIAVSQAMKDTIAAINEKEGTRHEVYVYSSYETTGFINKMAQRNANDLYDGLTIHPYSGTPDGSGATFYDSAMLKAENVGIRNVQNYVNMMPADKVPVISEYGIFRSTDALVRSQTHAIYIAKVLMEYVRLGSPYIQKHCLVDWYSAGADSLGPTQQAVIQAVPGSDANTLTGEGTFTFFSTPSAHVFKMINSGFGDRVVFTEFSSVPTMSNGVTALSALASKANDGTVYVAIVNASREEDYKLTLDLENIELDGAVVTAQVLTADSFDAQNSPENPNNVTVTTENVSFDADNFTYTVPKHTFVILKIDPAVDSLQNKEVSVRVGEKLTVTDNSGYYVGMDTSGIDTSIATVDLSGTKAGVEMDISDPVTSFEGGKQYAIKNTRSGMWLGNQASNNNRLFQTGSADAVLWNITPTEGGYYIQDPSGKYLTFAAGTASLTDSRVVVTVTTSPNTAGAWQIGYNGQYLNDHNQSDAGGYNISGDGGSQWVIYEAAINHVTAKTDITFTGVKAGKTSVQVGDVIYHVTVPHEHVFDRKIATEEYLATPADCENAATYYYSCECGEKDAGNTFEDGEALGHAWTVTYDFAADGSACTATRTCGNDAEHVETATATVTSEVTKAATCEAKGETTYTATFDVDWAETQTKTIADVDVVAHTPAEAVRENEKAATCTETGSYDEVVYCSVCGEEISRETKTIEKLAHTPAEAVRENEKAATCDKAGSYDEVVYCSVCGEEISRKTVTVDALGHKDANKDHKCDVCDKVLSECVDENKDYKCDICGKDLEKPEDPSDPVEEEEVIRLAGSHRWETALKVADEMKDNLDIEKFDAIIIASGNDFADALAGSYLSTVKNAPILLGWGKGGKFEYLDTDNIEYIKANLAEGGTVYILGGKNAVPELYENELKGYNVKRLGGANRFETNLLILAEAGVKDGSEILVCTSTNFADSLSASATAKPILLVFNEYGKLYGKQPEFLSNLKNCTFTVIGGESAVSADLAKAIEVYGKVERLAGANRFETSVMVAQKYFKDVDTAVLAYAWNYPDGLCGGSLAYSLKAPLILTMTKYEEQAVAYAKAAGIETGLVLGGETLISDEAVRAIFAMDAADEIIKK